MSICFTNAPFESDTQGGCLPAGSVLLQAALDHKDERAWVEFFRFPKCILLSPVRGGRRISRSQSLADLVCSRLKNWEDRKEVMWQDVLSRCQRGASRVSSPTPDLEKSVVAALRHGDVQGLAIICFSSYCSQVGCDIQRSQGPSPSRYVRRVTSL